MIDPLKEKRIDKAREYLLQSSLPEDAKDNLSRLLDAGEVAANGTPDKVGAMSNVLLELAIYEVKHAVRLPDVLATTIANAISAHADGCPKLAALAGATSENARKTLAHGPTVATVEALLGIFGRHYKKILGFTATVILPFVAKVLSEAIKQ